MTDEEPQAEIVINKSSSREGGVGWSIRLVRYRPPFGADTSHTEDDEHYTARVLAKHRELERELLGKVCCHDDCSQENKEANRA